MHLSIDIRNPALTNNSAALRTESRPYSGPNLSQSAHLRRRIRARGRAVRVRGLSNGRRACTVAVRLMLFRRRRRRRRRRVIVFVSSAGTRSAATATAAAFNWCWMKDLVRSSTCLRIFKRRLLRAVRRLELSCAGSLCDSHDDDDAAATDKYWLVSSARRYTISFLMSKAYRRWTKNNFESKLFFSHRL